MLVKALPVRHRISGRRMAPLSAHIAYLKREGVTRDGSPTRMFDAESDRADDRGRQTQDSEHHASVGESCFYAFPDAVPEAVASPVHHELPGRRHSREPFRGNGDMAFALSRERPRDVSPGEGHREPPQTGTQGLQQAVLARA